MSGKRSTAQRDRDRAAIRQGEPPCHLCGQPIDYSLPYLDPGEYVVDHVVPLALGGPDVRENKAAAHRACNRTKGDKLIGHMDRPRPKVRPFTTVRAW